jgi:hypothetical protein
VSLYCVHVSSTSQGTYVAGVNAATGKFLDQGFETQYIVVSQGGEQRSRLTNLSALYSLTLTPRPDTPSASTGAALTDGMMWYDYTLNKFRCRENGVTSDCFRAYAPGANDTDVFSERQEFTRYNGATDPWSVTGSGTCASASLGIAAENGHPGLIKLTTGIVATNACVYYYTVAPNTIGMMPPIGTGGVFDSYVSRFIFRSNVVANAQLAVNLETGLSSGATPGTQQANEIITFRVDNSATTTCATGATSVPAGRWHFAMRTGGGATWHCIDTALDASTLAVAANTWYEAVFWSTAPGTVNFGVKVAGAAIRAYGSANVAAIPTTALKPSFAITTLNTTAKSMDVDFWSGVITGLVR